MIPLVNLARQYQQLSFEIDAAIKDVCERGDFILGRAVARFEDAYARTAGARTCIGVASGTDALHLILRALGIGRGDEVILPANTFIATAQAVWCCGADPILVDCDEETATIDPEAAQRAITARTKAIVPVHLYGQPANMDRLLAIGRDHGLHIVEDAAQAHGAAHRGTPCGAMGVAAAFSFYPAKNLGACGDGGAITTNDDGLAEELRLLRNWGSTIKYVHTRMGFNSRLDTMQAAVLAVKLSHLQAWNARRNEIASQYSEALARHAPRVRIVAKAPWTTSHAYHLFVIRVPAPVRDRIVQAMQAGGVGVGIHYPVPIHRQEAFRPLLKERVTFPVTDRLAAEIISLPICGHITDAEVAIVVEELRKALE